ncbi:MAG: cation transporter [Clostridia bacterium]|nr:cation transporter [Clostridia bacterium]
MVKIIFNVEGMRCGMCESHVNDVVRKAGNVSKVTSSHSKNRTEVIAEDDSCVQAMQTAIEGQGYRVTGVTCQPYEKKGLFGKKK